MTALRMLRRGNIKGRAGLPRCSLGDQGREIWPNLLAGGDQSLR